MQHETNPTLQESRETALPHRTNRVGAGAFETIMRRHNRLVFRAARGIVGDDAEAQDVVQETFLRAFRAQEQFRGDSALGTWLARIAIHVALDAVRKRGRSIPTDDRLDIATEPAAEHQMAFAAPEGSRPEMQVERAQVQRLLQCAIDSLPASYRSVFMLRAVQEMSVAETACCLELGEDVVKTRYLRARALLRDALGARIEAHATEVYTFAGERCDAVVAHVLAQLRWQGRIDAEPSV